MTGESPGEAGERLSGSVAEAAAAAQQISEAAKLGWLQSWEKKLLKARQSKGRVLPLDRDNLLQQHS